jgi:hypothetical protein
MLGLGSGFADFWARIGIKKQAATIQQSTKPKRVNIRINKNKSGLKYAQN